MPWNEKDMNNLLVQALRDGRARIVQQQIMMDNYGFRDRPIECIEFVIQVFPSIDGSIEFTFEDEEIKQDDHYKLPMEDKKVVTVMKRKVLINGRKATKKS